ncbi:hypothetical protein [Streptomyces nitrosporeus]|uniref:hypothetical protein n=1 Tax=Streptomyces nitrosporeus TaxID=28894 RepID=UPI0039A132E0
MDGSAMVISAQERLADVMAAVVEVAAESGESGTYTAEVARTLTAVVGKVGARIAVEAEVRGFRSGWSEAMELAAGAPESGAEVLRMPSSEE